MEHVFKIGDEFMMKPIKGTRRDVCRYPNKTFIVHSMTLAHINYIDNRTSRKCRCQFCTPQNIQKINVDGSMEKIPYKRVSRSLITLVRTRNQRQREITLALLNL